MEHELEDIEQFFDSAATSMHWVDAEGFIVRANRRELELLGYEAHEYVGRHISEFHADPDVIADILERLGRNETLRDYEARLVAKDGSIREVVIDSNVRRGRDGEFINTRCFTRDVTERRRAERELEQARVELEHRVEQRTRELERSRRSLLDAQRIAQLGSWEWDLATGVADPSEELCRILGLEPEPLETFQARFLELIHPEDRERRNAEIRRVVRQGGPFEYDIRIARPDGKVRRLEVRGRAELDSDGTPLRLVGTAQDVTDYVDLAEERRRLEASWQEAQRLESLGLLAGGIAHDFNNLLVGMLGNASLALDELPDAVPGRERVADIELAGRRAAQLTKQLLAYSGQGSFVVERVDLVELVGELGHLLEPAVSRKVELEYELREQPTIVEADATELRQIVMNLIVNASEAHGGRKGSIRLRVGVETVDRQTLDTFLLGDDAPAGGYAVLEVSDEGEGMSDATMARIFDPFFTSKEAGYGLGLTGVLGIVRAQGGAIRVESAPGRGSRFTVLLPLSRAEAPSAAPAPKALPSPGSGVVLVVDDEHVIRNVAGAMLESAGFRVSTAADGEDAVAVFTRQPDEIDAIVLDLVMPGLSGGDVLREVRAVRPDVPVVVSSGYTSEALDGTLDSVGEVVFLQKPYTTSELLDAVGRALRRVSR